MSKSMLVNVVNNEESRIAIVSDGRLEELSIETAQQEQIEGNIYKARIVKVIASLDAVFVDYGRERNGFLAAPDVHPQYFRGDKRDVDALHKGQDLLVQVKKGEIGNKGAALTTYVSLPGRHFVLMPHVSKRGVSRRIEDEATRKQLRKILDDSGIPEEMGYIARTAAEGRTKQELTRDAGYLLRLWKTIQARYEKDRAPALLYEETDIVIRTLRDYFTPSIEEVLIDDEGIYQQVEAFFEAVMPTHKKRLKLYQAQAPLFSKHNLEDQIASIYAEKVPLPSGGSLVIEQTEALVSIDVNSGKTTSGRDIEETAFIANKEAAEEAARQLRLRDMGGLIVIDFIDMRPAKNRSEVRKVLQKALKEDKARTDTGTISKFGLLELSRQRLKGIARAGAVQHCPMCSGLGSIRTPESSALSVLRRVQLRLPRKGAVRQVLVGVPGTVATLLQNRHRTKLMDLESRFGTEIFVFAEEALAANQFYLEYRIKDRSEVETDLPEGFNRARLLAPQGLPDLPQRARRPSLYPLLGEEPETIEVPAEPDTEPETVEQTEAVAVAAGGAEEPPREPGRKRRRRRRRGRSNDNREESEDGSPEESGEETRFPATGSGYAAAETAAAESDAEAAELAAGSEPRPLSAASKRRQRRKRATARGRGDEGAAQGPQQPSEGPRPQSAGGANEVQPGTVENGQAPDTPEQPQSDSGTAAAAAEAPKTVPPVTATDAPDGDGVHTAEASKRPRRRRRRKPKSAEEVSEETSIVSAGEPAGPPSVAGPAEAPRDSAHGAEEHPTEEKPKRTRRPRKPKGPETTATGTSVPADLPAGSGAGSAETPVAEPPKSAPAKPRRTRKKKGAEEPALADPEVATEETKPARKPRSRAKPKTEAKAKATEESAEAGVPVIEKKPAKRASRARKPPPGPAAPAAASADTSAPAPKKTPRRRKTAKPASGGDSPPGSAVPTE